MVNFKSFAFYIAVSICTLGKLCSQTPGDNLEELNWFYIIDSTRSITVQELLNNENASSKFKKLDSSLVVEASHDYWLYANIDEHFIQDTIFLHPGDFDIAELYQFDGGKIINSQINGILVSPDDRATAGPPYSFLLHSPCEKIYLKVNDYNFYKQESLKPEWLSPSSFYRKQVEEKERRTSAKIGYSILCGLLLSFAIYPISLYFFVAKRYYLFYSIYIIFSFILFVFSIEKYGNTDFLFSYTPYILKHFETLVNVIALIFYFLFIHDFLELRQNAPLLGKAIHVYLIFVFLVVPIDLIAKFIFGEYTIGYQALPFSFTPAILFFILLTIQALKMKKLEANLVVFGIFMYLIGSGVSLLQLSGRIPAESMFFENHMSMYLIGTLGELVFFSLALSVKHNEITNAAITANMQLAHLQELETAKNKLYTNITHEFRTPITNILGISELIEKAPKQELTKRLSRIQDNGRRLLRLVNQLLDIARLESGQMHLNLIQTDIVHFLSYVVEHFQITAQKKKLQLVFHSDVKELVLDIDPEKVQQVISNLLSNAIKFTPENGKIKMSLAIQNENHLHLTIADNGIGIPEQDLGHIFDRFYQVNEHSGHYVEGSGIGLAMIKELVELMGGNIKATSELGAGTAFSITLPITHHAPLKTIPVELEIMEEEVHPSDQKAATASDLSSTHESIILIVEDNPDVIYYLKSLFADKYQIIAARNGKEGIAKALKHIPDIILSDVMMPKLNGFELCKKLKNDRRTSHIPIILITAKATQQDKQEGLEAGADAYLHKPFDKEELRARIENLIASRQRLIEQFKSNDLLSEYWQNKSQQEKEFLNQLHQTIKAHISEKIKVNKLCKALGISRTQLYRKVKALTGQSIGDFIRRVRLQHAKLLLQNTHDPIGQISAQVGFEDASYFSRIFYEEFGIKPSDIRRPGA